MEMRSHKTQRAGLVQLCCGRDPDANWQVASALVREAAAAGATYAQTPENTSLMEADRERLFAFARAEAETNVFAMRCAVLAAELKIHLHIGSIAVAVGPEKLANRSLLFSPAGALIGQYDKIHMFDVDLPSGESYRESRNFQGGNLAIVADLPPAKLGMTVCYDLRFPALYRSLAEKGAGILSVPSAFTRTTGEAHWHVLLRARAIETGSFVLAAAQSGRHENGRETFGKSLIIGPWGEVIAEAPDGPGFIVADIDIAEVETARVRTPALQHARPFARPETAIRKSA